MNETEILEYTLIKHDYLIDVNMNNYEIIEFKQQENMVLLIVFLNWQIVNSY